jgi:hypothetical protein
MEIKILNKAPHITLEIKDVPREAIAIDLQKKIDSCTTAEELTKIMEVFIQSDPVVTAFYNKYKELEKLSDAA